MPSFQLHTEEKSALVLNTPNAPPHPKPASQIFYPGSIDLSSSPDSAFNKIWNIKQYFLK